MRQRRLGIIRMLDGALRRPFSVVFCFIFTHEYNRSMEIIGKLMGSEEKVKIMRLFLLNPETPFDPVSICERSKITRGALRREIGNLLKIGFVRPRSFVKEIEKKRHSTVKISKKRMHGWQLAPEFPLLSPVRKLLISAEPLKPEDIVERFRKSGKLQLVIVSGVFIQNDDSRADILIVGDNLRRKAIENTLRSIEAEVGKELAYAYFETADFLYRLNIYDKFIRDILDYPHEKIYDKLGIV